MINENTYLNMSDAEKREVAIYGCTVEQMREAVTESLSFRFSSPTAMALSLISDASNRVDPLQGEIDWLERDEIRQQLNRAKWILSAYNTEQK